MEHDYFHEGGAHDSQSLYLFRMSQDQEREDSPLLWQLAGVVTTFKSGNKPSYVADLKESFHAIDSSILNTHQ